MKASVFYEVGKPLRIEDIPIPQLGSSDVLVKVEAAGINGGDVQLLHGAIEKQYLPIILLHEISGIVEEVGSEVRNFKRGDKVIVDPILSCEHSECVYCSSGRNNLCEWVGCIGLGHLGNNPYGKELFFQYANGGLAEYVKVRQGNLIKMSESISFEVGAKLATVAVGLQAVKKIGIMPTDTIIINAASGSTGACVIKCVQVFRPRRIIAIARDEGRLKRLKSWGNNIETISIFKENVRKSIKELTGNKGADSLIDIAPQGAVNSTLDCIYSLKKGGKAILIGGTPEKLNIRYRFIMVNEIEVMGAMAYNKYAISLAEILTSQGTLDFSDLVTHRFSLDKANEAFETLDKKIGNPIWVIVRP